MIWRLGRLRGEVGDPRPLKLCPTKLRSSSCCPSILGPRGSHLSPRRHMRISPRQVLVFNVTYLYNSGESMVLPSRITRP